jgi:taurine-pyruvate aminotransferase
VIKNHVFRSFYGEPATNRQVLQVSPYRGHPAEAAVALRNIENILDERLAERAVDTRRYLLDGLKTLMHHSRMGDVRGRRFLVGVELVTDRGTCLGRGCCVPSLRPAGSTDRYLTWLAS